MQEWYFTAGISHALSDAMQFNAMAFYSPSKNVTGATITPNQQLSISMEQSGLVYPLLGI